MFVTLLGCTQWLYLGNCFVCCKADKKLYNPRGWHLLEIFKVDVKLLPERTLPLRGVVPFPAAAFRGGGGHAVPQSCTDFQRWPNEGHVQGFILLIMNKQYTLNLFFLLAPFSSDTNVNVQRNEVSNGFLQLSLPFRAVHGI